MALFVLLFISGQLFSGQCGDINEDGEVNVVDALLMAQYYVTDQKLALSLADTSGDGVVDIVDALLIAQFQVGIISEISGCKISTHSVLTPDSYAPDYPMTAAPFGYASLSWNGQDGVTGGAGGTVVMVTTAEEFLDYIAKPGPYIIQVSGMISLPGFMHEVTSDKSIIGLGGKSGITGGGGLNIGLPISHDILAPPENAVHNIIIRNLNFSQGLDDQVNIMMYSHHVWVDHCSFDGSELKDGAVDIKRGSNYITVSWNHFFKCRKACLCGHSDGNSEQDRGYLKVTYHNNFFDHSGQRHPRVRFGEVHVFNNYHYFCGVGVIGGSGSRVYVEANYFERTAEPFENKGGQWQSVNNVFVGYDELDEGGTVGWHPSKYYTYTATTAEEAKIRTQEFAGAGKLKL